MAQEVKQIMNRENMKVLMMLACAALCVAFGTGCGSDEAKSSEKIKSGVSAKDPYAKYLKQVKTCTNYPDLELKVYRKAIKSVVDKSRSEGAGESLQDSAVSAILSQLPESFKQFKGMPNEKETLERMVNELEF